MIRVLFVCLGNICRSPSAEAVFRDLVIDRKLDKEVETDSAGTGAWHIGNPPDERAQLVGRTRGYEMSDLRARQVVASDFDLFDYIVAMDNSNFNTLDRLRHRSAKGKLVRMLDFGGTGEIEVPDPYYGELEDYSRVFDLLEPAAADLLDHICKTDL